MSEPEEPEVKAEPQQKEAEPDPANGERKDRVRELRDLMDSADRAEQSRLTEMLTEFVDRISTRTTQINVTNFQAGVGIGGNFSVGAGAGGAGRVAGQSGLLEVDPAIVASLARMFVPPGRLGEAAAALDERHLLLIAAPSGTGRYSSAVYLLRDAVPDGALYEMTDVTFLDQAWEPPHEHAGYVMEIDQDRKLDSRRLDRLATELERAGCRMVLLAGSSNTESSYAIDGLGEIDPVMIIARRILGDDPRPEGVTELRRVLTACGALSLPNIESSPAMALELADAALKELDLAAEVSRMRDRHLFSIFEECSSPGKVCFLLAVSVLEDSSYLTASDAAVQLYDLLSPEEEGIPRLSFYGRIGIEFPWIVQDMSSGIRLIDSIPRESVLAYAWVHLDGQRSALLDWLRRLIASPDIEVRFRAAAASAVLAQLDHGYALHRFLRPWSRDSMAAVRAGAATALSIVGANPRLTDPVWREIESWAEGRTEDHRLRATAATAVGTPLGAASPDRAFPLLRRALDDDTWRGLMAVGQSMARLVELECEDQALAALLDWSHSSDDSPVAVQALLVFLFVALAPMPWNRDQSGPAGLPLLSADGGRNEDKFHELWARALAHAETRDEALETLRLFLDEHGVGDPAGAKAARLLVTAIAARGPRDRRRLTWHLAQWAEDRHQPSQTAARLHQLLTTRTQNTSDSMQGRA